MSNFHIPVDTFVAQMDKRGSFVRNNFFAVTFVGPEGVTADPIVVSALCESTSLPGRSISTTELGKGSMQAVKFPYGWINDDVTFTFLVTKDFYIKKIWDTWMRRVADPQSGFIGYKKFFKSDITISVLDLEHNEIYQTTLINAYPISMGAIELSNASSNELMRLTVTVTFDNFTTKTNNFEFVSSTYDFNQALSIPNPLINSLSFNPFQDISDQIEFGLQSAKTELQTNLNNALNGITNNLKNRYAETITTITAPFNNAFKSINNQIKGSLNDIVGAINNPINAISDRINSAIGNAINAPISKITSSINTAIGKVSDKVVGFISSFLPF